MYTKLTLAKKYLHYYFTASNGKGHGIHSPFIFDFIKNVLNDERDFYAFTAIENLRTRLLTDDRTIMVEDLGAGSAVTKSNNRSIRNIAKHALKSKKFGRLLFRIVNHYQPGNIIELGTSLGISTAYLAAGNANGSIYTIEGSPAIADVAQNNFDILNLYNTRLLRGSFDEALPGLLNELRQVDLVFVDGNHRLEPTIRYFDLLLQYSHENTILIFDDIHWSAEMEAAWKKIRQNEQVTATVDLFFMGLVFFRKDFKAKQDFMIRF